MLTKHRRGAPRQPSAAQHLRRARAARPTTRRIHAAAALLLAFGCVQNDGERWTPLQAFEPMSADDEREFGMELDRQLQEKLRILRDPVVAGFVNDLGQHIVRQIEPQPFVYRFRIIADPRINAFAISGGYIYLHSGALMAAGSLDELAGVVGHEVAHVQEHHYARLVRRAQLPSLLSTAATLAAAVAVQQPGIFIAGQAANVSMQLRYTREFEREADHFGTIFAARAGFDPQRLGRFFERILSERELPPYLYSHPDVEERIASLTRATESLAPVGSVPASLRERFEPVRRRVAELLQMKREELFDATTWDAATGEPALAAARARHAAGAPDEAIAMLRAATREVPRDPRISFQLGDWLLEHGRPEEAIPALRRTVELDPTRALVFHRLGLAYRDAGERHRAVYAQEQAVLRSSPNTQVRRRAEWEIEKATFGVVTALALTRDDDRGVTLRARVTGRFLPYRDELEFVWLDSAGIEQRRAKSSAEDRLHVSDRYVLPDASASDGWSVRIELRGDTVAEQPLAP